jgi:hypothetical protein
MAQVSTCLLRGGGGEGCTIYLHLVSPLCWRGHIRVRFLRWHSSIAQVGNFEAAITSLYPQRTDNDASHKVRILQLIANQLYPTRLVLNHYRVLD